MTAAILTVAQQKGGAGKTTVAVQLAVAWAGAGLRVCLLDIDPQGSVSAWFAARTATLGAGNEGLTAVTVAGFKVASELDRRARDSDIVIVDTPPHAETEARAAIRAGSLVLIPVQPSPMDLWATRPTLDLATRERRQALLVPNRMPARGTLRDQILAQVAADGLPCTPAMLGNRVAFAASMMAGRGVAETEPRGVAAAEIQALARDIETRMGSR